MTRRQPVRRRVEKDAAANLRITELYAAAEARYGRVDGPLRLMEMCANLEWRAMNADDDDNDYLVAYLRAIAADLWLSEEERLDTDDLARAMAQIARRIHDEVPVIRCEWHGWIEPYLHGECEGCPCRLPNYRPGSGPEQGGRPGLYCSKACRQRAYRQRRKGMSHLVAET